MLTFAKPLKRRTYNKEQKNYTDAEYAEIV